MSNLEVKKDWMDYTNLAANIHQSIKLGEISNQLSQLTSINTEILGNMNNLVNIEVYKLEKEETEKEFKQLIFNLNKFMKNKHEDPLTITLLKYGHCDMMNSLMNNFQKELKSFEDKEYVEKIIDGFDEYSSSDVDLNNLSEEEDDVTLLLSYLIFTESITAKTEKLTDSKEEIDLIKSQHYTLMQTWTYGSLNKHFDKIAAVHHISRLPLRFSRKSEYRLTEVWNMRADQYINKGKEFQIIFKRDEDDIYIDFMRSKEEYNSKAIMWLFGESFKTKIDRIENEILPSLIGKKETNKQELSKEVQDSLNTLTNDLKKPNANWINVEKNLLDIIYDTNIAIQGPYQYRKQVIGD